MGKVVTPTAYTPTAAVAYRSASHSRPSADLAGCADTLVRGGVGGGMHVLCVLQDLIHKYPARYIVRGKSVRQTQGHTQ